MYTEKQIDYIPSSFVSQPSVLRDPSNDRNQCAGYPFKIPFQPKSPQSNVRQKVNGKPTGMQTAELSKSIPSSVPLWQMHDVLAVTECLQLPFQGYAVFVHRLSLVLLESCLLWTSATE